MCFQYGVPRLELVARQQGPKASPCLWERLSRLLDPEVLREGAARQPERDFPRQPLYQRLREALSGNACRSSTFFSSWTSQMGTPMTPWFYATVMIVIKPQ